jgi:hypothetical protein
MPSNDEIQEISQKAAAMGIKMMCNLCQSDIKTTGGLKKVKFCQFCAQANCPKCCSKTMVFPSNNKDKIKRGNICIKCDKKLAYQEILNINAKKLEIKDSKWQA